MKEKSVDLPTTPSKTLTHPPRCAALSWHSASLCMTSTYSSGPCTQDPSLNEAGAIKTHSRSRGSQKSLYVGHDDSLYDGIRMQTTGWSMRASKISV